MGDRRESIPPNVFLVQPVGALKTVRDDFEKPEFLTISLSKWGRIWLEIPQIIHFLTPNRAYFFTQNTVKNYEKSFRLKRLNVAVFVD